MRIIINFATKTRMAKCFNCLNNLRTLTTLNNYFVLLKADLDDLEMNNHAVEQKLKFYPEVKIKWGYSANKIAAINRDINPEEDPFDILINLSDDQLFLVKGFDEIIIEDMKRLFPDTDGFLHYPDQKTGAKIPTMSIIGRKYYERDGYVYHPDFENVYCDNYAMDVAKKRCRYAFINNNLYGHFHPVWGLAEWDEQYRRTDSKESFAKDRATYLRLKAENFGI